MQNLSRVFLPLLLCLSISLNAQQTIGVFQYDSLAQEGYTLFAPTANSATYLIDNCGRKINQWPGPSTPGLSVYLLENGQLLRTNKLISTNLTGGGAGGTRSRTG